MNAFDFNKLDAKLNKQKILDQKRKQQESKILKFYKDAPINPEVIKFVDIIHSKYKDHYNGNRYYSISKNNVTAEQNTNQIKPIKLVQSVIQAMSYPKDIEKQKQSALVQQPLLKKKLSFFQTSKINADFVQSIVTSLASLTTSKKMNRLRLAYKFRKNIKIIIQKMKNMKITIQDIFQKKLFSKEPYLFGKQIFISTKQGQQTQVFRILLQNKFSVFSRDSTQKTPLMWSAIRNRHRVFDLLLSNGSDPLAQDFKGHSVWFYIVKYNSLQCAKILILNLCPYDEVIESNEIEQVMRNYITLYKKPAILKMLKDLKFEKRDTYFMEQYRYHYHD